MRYHKAKPTGTDDPTTGGSLTDRAREAGRILDQSLDAARNEASEPATSLAVLRTRVESRAQRLAASKENTIMSAVTKPLNRHRKLSFGVVFAVLVFAFLTLVPFEYQRTVGYQATFAGIDPAAGLSLDRLESALIALGYSDTEFGLHTTGEGITCQVSGLPSRYAVREFTAALAGMTGFSGAPEVAPMVETVSGSLYAQVKCELSDFDDFSFEGKTDDEIKAEIEKRLAERGCTDATVQVISNVDPDDADKREIVIKVKDSSCAGDNYICNALLLEGIDLDDKSKTDTQLEQEIQQRLVDAGKTNAEVSVTTRPDGKRRIELKCTPE